ncbi:MAG: serine hydrolase domain-containing protein [Pseudomonadota bacterium]
MSVTRRPLLLGALASAVPVAAFAQSASDFEGEWNGALHVSAAMTLRLHLVIAPGPQATIFSIDQGNARIPAATTTITGDAIAIAFPSIGASYTGRLSNGHIEGTFTQGQTFPLSFERGAAPAAPVQTPPTALTPSVLRTLREQSGAPALAAAATKLNGRHIGLADGLRQAGASAPVTTHDKWHLGSITKSMTATLVARCVEAGAVSWDDTLGAVLGASVPDMRAEYRDVSFRHLLCHRAGLQGDIPMDQFAHFPRESADARADRIAVARIALALPPVGPKETTFQYANNGFILAGAMLEAKLGAPWESLVRARVFDPLHMNSAGFGAPGTAGRLDEPVGHGAGLLSPHTPYPPGGQISDNPAFLGPAGRVHASFDDMLVYLAAHRDRTDLLRRESWDTLHTPPFGGNYAMGWVVQNDMLWHNGSNTLWYAEVAIDRGRGIVAIAAANDGNLGAVQPKVNAALGDAAEAVASPA